MNKLTISAALLALTMTACSESGMDHSVAPSTSEIQKENILEQLTVVPENIPEFLDSNSPLMLQKAGAEWSGQVFDDSGIYRFFVYASDDTYDAGNKYTVRSLITKKSDARPGEWNPYRNTVSHYQFSVCTRGCSSDGVCQEHQFVVKQGGSYTSELARECAGYSTTNNPIGIVAAASVSINGGDVSLSATYRKNLSNDLAKKVYQNYLVPGIVSYILFINQLLRGQQ
jgi:hypothetical protein